MLVVAAGLVTARAVKDAILRRERTRQRNRALVMQPRVKAILRLPVVAAPVEVHDHHARFVAVGAVAERADAREAPVAARFTFTVHQEMHRVRTVEFIEHRLGGEELGALGEAATPVAGNGRKLPVEVELEERGPLRGFGQNDARDFQYDLARFARGQSPGPFQMVQLRDWR